MSYKIKPWLYEKPEEDKQLTQTWIRPKHMLYQGRERECFAVSLLCLWGLGAHGKPWQTCYEVSGFRPTYRILGPKALSSERFQPKCPRFLMDRDEGTGRWGKAPAVFLGSAGTSPMHTHPVHFPQSWALETQASLYKFQSTVQPFAPIQTLPISSLPPCCFEKLLVEAEAHSPGHLLYFSDSFPPQRTLKYNRKWWIWIGSPRLNLNGGNCIPKCFPQTFTFFSFDDYPLDHCGHKPLTSQETGK